MFSFKTFTKYASILSACFANPGKNIFSYDDFKTMLETIVIPYDILNYLAYRTVFKTVNKGNLVIDDVDDMATFLTLPQNETDYAELFLA